MKRNIILKLADYYLIKLIIIIKLKKNNIDIQKNIYKYTKQLHFVNSKTPKISLFTNRLISFDLKIIITICLSLSSLT